MHSIFLKDTVRFFPCGNNSYGQLWVQRTNSSIPSKIEISVSVKFLLGKYKLYSIEMTIVFLDVVVTFENEISPESNTLSIQSLFEGLISMEQTLSTLVKRAHFIYNFFNSCISEESQVNILEVPNAVISLTGQDTLITEDASLYQWFLDGNLILDANLQYYVSETSEYQFS